MPNSPTSNSAPRFGLTLAVAALLIAGFLAALAHFTAGFRVVTAEDARRLRLAEEEVRLSPVALTDSAGATLTPWPASNAVYLVDFIFTRCQTVCTQLGGEYQRMQQRIIDADLGQRVKLLSVSFDPAFDTPQALAGYARRFGAEPLIWRVGVPRRADELDRLLRESGVLVIADGRGGYAHNAAIHVIDGRGRLLRAFDYGQFEQALFFAAEISR